MLTEAQRRRLSKLIRDYAGFVREHEMRGSRTPEEARSIELEYEKAKTELEKYIDHL